MKEVRTSPTQAPRRHLHSPQAVARAAGAFTDADLTRSHGQGNGLRIHRIYFAAVSLAAFVLVIGAVFLTTARM